MNAETAAIASEIDWDVALARLEELNALSESADLWNNPEKAQTVMKERNRLDAKIKAVRELESGLADNVGLVEMGE